jgi:hypothetical protein
MTMPNEPLGLKLPADLDDWLIGDLEMFETGTFTISSFKAMVTKYSNWTPKEINQLTRREMRAVLPQLYDKFLELAVPKANGANS